MLVNKAIAPRNGAFCFLDLVTSFALTVYRDPANRTLIVADAKLISFLNFFLQVMLDRYRRLYGSSKGILGRDLFFVIELVLTLTIYAVS